MGFGWGGFGEGMVHKEEGQNCLLNADGTLQGLLVIKIAGITRDLSHIVYVDLLGSSIARRWSHQEKPHRAQR